MTKHLFVAFLFASAAPALAQSISPQVADLRERALKDDYAYDIVEGLTTEVGLASRAPMRKRGPASGRSAS